VREPPIILTYQWGAAPPRERIQNAGQPERIIFHHTAGHAPDIDGTANESKEEAFRYARAIQAYHMGLGWNDSGHNFLVCRNGLILVGRHNSYPRVKAGLMVVSAHCPGQNDQPGIEHEHLGAEPMTTAQFQASAWLHAWVIHCCGMRSTGTIIPHSYYIPTACPGALATELHALRQRVVSILNHGGP